MSKKYQLSEPVQLSREEMAKLTRHHLLIPTHENIGFDPVEHRYWVKSMKRAELLQRVEYLEGICLALEKMHGEATIKETGLEVLALMEKKGRES